MLCCVVFKINYRGINMRNLANGLSWVLYDQIYNKIVDNFTLEYNKRDLNQHDHDHTHHQMMSTLCPLICSLTNVIVFIANTSYINNKYHYYTNLLKTNTDYDANTCKSTKHLLDSNWRHKMLLNTIFIGSTIIFNVCVHDMTSSCVAALITTASLPIANYFINKQLEHYEFSDITFSLNQSKKFTMADVIRKEDQGVRMA